MDQCKCVASGFLANGGILEIWWVKVNLKRIFCLVFCKPGEGMRLKRQKDQVNHCGKRLRAGFNEK
jgi:hypothetical protein